MTQPIPGGKRRIDHVLDPGFLAGVDRLPIAELRARRHEAQQEEADLSYLRRMLHGRIDIVKAEMARRSGDREGSLVESLGSILADPQRTGTASGRHLTVEPSRVDEHRRRVEHAIADTVVSDVTARTDAELAASLADLASDEREVSELRHQVQVVADALADEVARRYRDGLASVDDLLASAQAATGD